MTCIFFAHIPKTAGTSFRVAAEKYWGEKAILSDYGKDLDNTSREIVDHVYNSPDFYKVISLSMKGDKKLLAGHVPVSKYNPIFSCHEIASFVRNPIEQVISHFEHHVRHLGYKASLESFIEESNFINMQSRLLSGIPLKLYGFLGITEHYSDSIDVFNNFYGAGLEKLSLNTKQSKTKYKPLFQSPSQLDNATYDHIAKKNSNDMRAYQIAFGIFRERLRLLREGKPYTFGFVDLLNRSMVAGVAYGKDFDEASSVEILLNKTVVGEAKATEMRPHLRKLNVPRKGYIGFTFRFGTPISEQDEIICRVKNTGQVLSGPGKL